MTCTWKGCTADGKVPQRDIHQTVWAVLCEDHHQELDHAITSVDAKATVQAWVLAQGGSDTATKRLNAGGAVGEIIEEIVAKLLRCQRQPGKCKPRSDHAPNQCRPRAGPGGDVMGRADQLRKAFLDDCAAQFEALTPDQQDRALDICREVLGSPPPDPREQLIKDLADALENALRQATEHNEGCLYCGEGEIVDGTTTPEHHAECWWYIASALLAMARGGK